MTPCDLDPDLERLGDALRASTEIDLARDEQIVRTDRPEPARAGFLRRPRVLAGSTLGLAGAGAAIVLALSGTAPAYAITHKSDGSVFLKINFGGHDTLLVADGTLVDKYNETVMITTAPGQSTNPAPIECTPTPDRHVAGDPVPTGPRVKLLIGKDNTFAIPSGSTGAGTVHLTSCQTYVSYPNHSTGSGNTGVTRTAVPIPGNTGNTGG